MTVRNEHSYTSTELRKAAQMALTDMLNDDDFNEFVEEYKKAHGGKRPFIKIAPVKNNTDDPDLATGVAELNSFIENQLRLSKKVRISRYEGVERIGAIGASRANEDDDNFRQETVAKRGTIEAAVLVMRPHLTSNNAPERSGAVPAGALVKLCFSGKYDEKTIYKMLVGNGGFNAYLGTNDARDVEKMIEQGDAKAKEVYDAFIYQICKNIGSQAAVLEGKVDQIIFTGGIAYSKYVIDAFKEKVAWIAPITVYPGEDELLALAQGGLRVLNGEEMAMEY